MTDLQISKALALAIGWPLVQVCKGFLKDNVEVWVAEHHHDSDWRVFDYRDWNVIGPIAARHDCFPMRGLTDAFWHSCCVTGEGSVNVHADTPQKAIALAVIKHHEARK